jgi:hypothetical protein
MYPNDKIEKFEGNNVSDWLITEYTKNIPQEQQITNLNIPVVENQTQTYQPQPQPQPQPQQTPIEDLTFHQPQQQMMPQQPKQMMQQQQQQMIPQQQPQQMMPQQPQQMMPQQQMIPQQQPQQQMMPQQPQQQMMPQQTPIENLSFQSNDNMIQQINTMEDERNTAIEMIAKSVKQEKSVSDIAGEIAAGREDLDKPVQQLMQEMNNRGTMMN